MLELVADGNDTRSGFELIINLRHGAKEGLRLVIHPACFRLQVNIPVHHGLHTQAVANPVVGIRPSKGIVGNLTLHGVVAQFGEYGGARRQFQEGLNINRVVILDSLPGIVGVILP